jgi:segregation and condensation protein B
VLKKPRNAFFQHFPYETMMEYQYQKRNRPNYSMSELSSENPLPDLEACLEALLFVAGGPVSTQQLAAALNRRLDEVEQGLKGLGADYAQQGGLSLQWHAGRVQLTTAPHVAALVEKFLGLEATARLSRAALETLAIIAYRQPITRPGIDVIRGVSSDGVLKSLLSKGLIQEAGRAEGPGRPILFETTTEFLQHFGLSSLGELPSFEAEGQAAEEEKLRLLKD